MTYTFGHDHIYRLILKKLKTKQDKTPPKRKQENNSENTWTNVSGLWTTVSAGQ